PVDGEDGEEYGEDGGSHALGPARQRAPRHRAARPEGEERRERQQRIERRPQHLHEPQPCPDPQAARVGGALAHGRVVYPEAEPASRMTAMRLRPLFAWSYRPSEKAEVTSLSSFSISPRWVSESLAVPRAPCSRVIFAS